MAGELDVLTCGDGHAELRFDKDDPIETDRARRAVTALLRSGCILFIERDGKTVRVEGFDPATDCYLITDVPEPDSGEHDAENEATSEEPKTAIPKAAKEPAAKPKAKRTGRRKKKVPAESVNATAVPMRAGG